MVDGYQTSAQPTGNFCQMRFMMYPSCDHPGSGRGWAVIKDGKLSGHLYIHMCDDSGFVAEKLKP